MIWLELIILTPIFLFLTFLSFSLPGYWLLNIKLKNDQGLKNYALVTVVGFVLFTLVSYFLMIIHLLFLLLILILVIDILYLKPFSIPKFNLNFNWLILLFLLGIIGQLLIIAPSGLTINGNLLFWSAHGHDGVWHLALVQELEKNWPWQNPDFAGEKLVNYHFFSD